jgi:hypothetical protein
MRLNFEEDPCGNQEKKIFEFTPLKLLWMLEIIRFR